MGIKAELNRQQILETADGLFYRQGYDHTSFTDIADAVGIARGNFYYYFKTKDEILSAVISKRSENARQTLQEWDKEFPDARDRLKRYIQTLTQHKDAIEQYGCPLGSLCTEMAKLQHSQQDDANKLFEIFRNWLVEQFSLLGHKNDAVQLALHLQARTQGVALVTNAYRDQAFLQNEAKDLEDWVDQL